MNSASLRAQRAARTREALAVAAVRLFGRLGYAEASVDDIAAEAGVTKGAFYVHFADKAAALREATARWAHRRTERLAAARTFARAVCAFVDYADHPDDASLAAELWRRALHEPETHAALTRVYRTWGASLAEIAWGDPAMRAPALTAASAALALHDGVVAGRCAGLEPPAETLTAELVDALNAGKAGRRTA